MRRRYITHPAFQFRMMFYFVVGCLVIVGILGVVAFGTLVYISQQSFISPDQKTFLIERMKEMGIYIFYMTGILASISFIIGFFVSYHMVGPLNRLESWMEMALQGHRPPPIKLRNGDEMFELGQSLNKVLDKYGRGRGPNA